MHAAPCSAHDGDGQHPPKVVADLMAAMDERTEWPWPAVTCRVGGLELVGCPSSSLPRRPGSWSPLLPGTVGRVTDPMSGFFLVRRDVVATATSTRWATRSSWRYGRGDVLRVVKRPYVSWNGRRANQKSLLATTGLSPTPHAAPNPPAPQPALMRYLLVTVVALWPTRHLPLDL
ncbi:MAG: hypothetical protein Ct9H300mP12_10910 [Acidimicrobiales bacterium]|nr:MAG: hypothetical protein Ct9H300mP12_10910 [Acidimicrobiales bacterium]